MLRVKPVIFLFFSSLYLTACYLEGGGCSGNVCVSAGHYSCDGHHDCIEELRCEDSVQIRQRMASIISEARQHSRQCGEISYTASEAVLWNPTLAVAAERHSKDMATHNFLSHTGSDGSTPAARATEAGYDYSRIAENIAGGHETSSSVVNAWLDSPEHCANIMNPALEELAAACVKDHHSDLLTYWTLIIGSQSKN